MSKSQNNSNIKLIGIFNGQAFNNLSIYLLGSPYNIANKYSIAKQRINALHVVIVNSGFNDKNNLYDCKYAIQTF